MQGFKLRWNLLDGRGADIPENKTETWKISLPSKYLRTNKALVDVIELVSIARQSNINLDFVWSSVVDYKTRWIHDNMHQTSWCLDSVTEAKAIKDIRLLLNVTDVKDVDGIRDTDLELGTQIFSVLHYCPKYVVEANKLSIFYDYMSEEKSLRTIIQTTMNLINPEFGPENVRLVKTFYREMDNMFNFSLESALIALGNTEDIRNVMDESLFSFEKHEHDLRECLGNGNCTQLQHLMLNIGKPLSFLSFQDLIFYFIQVMVSLRAVIPRIFSTTRSYNHLQLSFLSAPSSLFWEFRSQRLLCQDSRSLSATNFCRQPWMASCVIILAST